LYGVFVWARRALNSRNRRFPARADYQIPSDLLTFDGDAALATASEKVAAVKGHVAAVQEMIAAAKAVELKEQEEETKIEEERAKARANSRMERGEHFVMEEMEVEMMAAPTSASVPMASKMNLATASMVQMDSGGAAPVKGHRKRMSSRGNIEMVSGSDMLPPIPPKPPPNLHTTGGGGGGGEAATGVDLTQIPKLLDARFEELDEDSALRPTLIKTGVHWTKKTQKGLLSKLSSSSMSSAEQKTEKSQAFDLLDALSRSGALPIASAELHVMVAATHCFDKSLVETVIQDNVNPIEKLERSALIVACTIHAEPATGLLNDDQHSRVATYSPGLFEIAEPGFE
jgi:hypothetical protein